MAFFTSLTGLNAATAQLGVTSNNIANAGTTGFKRSRAEFGDIFSSSPLQKASSVIGQGTILKGVAQEFSQGNIEFSQNTLDLAISGQGFFALKPDFTSVQTVYTRNGSFSLNNDRYVVDGSGQYLLTFPVNEDGSVISTALNAAKELRIPDTSGLPRASSEIALGLNLPAAAEVIPQREIFTSGKAEYRFDPTNPDTYNTSTSITVFDSLGNPSIATIYYVKTQNASVQDPTNKWQTYIFVGGREIKPALISVKDDRGDQVYINRFGQLVTDPRVGNPNAVPPIPGDPGFIPGTAHPKYILDDQQINLRSQPARIQTKPIIGDFSFGSTGDDKQFVGAVDPATGFPPSNSLPSQNIFEISIDGSNYRTIGIDPNLLETIPRDANGERRLDGVQLASLLTTAINREFGDERFFDLATNNQLRINAFTRDDDDVFQPLAGVAGNIDINLPLTRTQVFVPDVGKLNVDASFNPFNPASSSPQTHLFSDQQASIIINGVTIAGPFETEGRGSLIALVSAINNAEESTGVRAFLRADTLELRATQGNGGFDKPITIGGSVGQRIASLAGLEFLGSPQPLETNRVFELNETFTGVNELGDSGEITVPLVVILDNERYVIQTGNTPLGLVNDVNAADIGLTAFLVNAETGETVSEDFEGPVRLRFSGNFDTLVMIDPPVDVSLEDLLASDALDGADNLELTDVSPVPPPTPGVIGRAETREVRYTPELIQEYIQEQVDAAGLAVNVRYDVATRSLSFKPNESVAGFEIQGLRVQGLVAGQPAQNTILGFGDSTQIISVGQDLRDPDVKGRELVPNGRSALPTSQQRYGVEVSYLRESQRFEFASGTTGEDSRIEMRATAENIAARDIFQIRPGDLERLAGEGLASIPAVTVSGQPARNISGSFLVTEQDNKVSVSVDGVSGLIALPAGPYTGETFARELERRINLIEDAFGRKVSGVRVTYDVATERFTFQSGTATDNSFISVNGHPNWGLSNVTAERGRVPVFANLAQDLDELGRPIFIDRDGNETPDGAPTAGQNWFPVYLRKGELTFDTQGRLISPKEGAQYDPFDPLNGADPIVLNVDYGRNSTQFNAPFSLLSLSQDGFPPGKLDGLEVDATGVVRATYTNGQQLALGKVILANFANPNGLKQIGDANYLTTASSGDAILGQAGGEGFGTIQGGARERSNVDLTQELVDLITAQRNFQANAKAIETSTTLTQTIINIRG